MVKADLVIDEASMHIVKNTQLQLFPGCCTCLCQEWLGQLQREPRDFFEFCSAM